MALNVEGILCCCMHWEMRGSRALEPLHLALSSSGRLMRILGSVVAPSTAFMAFCDSRIPGCSLRSEVIVTELAGRGMNLVLIARSILQDLADSLGAQYGHGIIVHAITH